MTVWAGPLYKGGAAVLGGVLGVRGRLNCPSHRPRSGLTAGPRPLASRPHPPPYTRAGDGGLLIPALSGPLEHLTDQGALVFVRYLAVGGRPSAAVSEPIDDPKLGRATLPYPNNKSNIYYTESVGEAYFLAAFLNSAPAQDALARFAVSTGVTPAALERLPLPRFDSNSEAHVRLGELGRAAHVAASNDPEALPELEQEIAALVWTCCGLQAPPDRG